MKKYLEQLEENCREHGEFLALKSQARMKGLCYSQLWEYSGRVYAYLKKHGFGKEDMLLICLPRGMRTLVTALGIWRAGAAFTIVEANYAPERIEYIRSDCGCVLTVDEKTYAEMMLEPALEAYEPTAPHDAAFAVYTSGSTGNPKGVLHEYGKLEQLVDSHEPLYSDLPENAVIANPAPMNFVACIAAFIGSTYFSKCFYNVSYDITRDVCTFSEDIQKNNVVFTFMPPSLLRSFRTIPSSLIKILVASEPCNGLYHEKPQLVNVYTSSEVAFSIAEFAIDRPYDITPVGKKVTDADIRILDEDGALLPNGQTGEICVQNEYTRGYIHLPEKTAEAFVDHLYHTGDLGYISEDGLLVVQGRKDDMIKINGNRIEPAEIESAIRKVLGTDKVIAKGFIEENRSYICAYLIRDELRALHLLNAGGKLLISPAEMAERISAYLPYYMIPSYYVVLEEYPKNANGKIAKKELKAPEVDAFREEYEAPWNLVEAHFCELFGKVLQTENVSVHDDFYLLGGDSLSAMELVSKCRYKGIRTADIYKYRTPRNIADHYIDDYGILNVDSEQKNTKALEHLQPLAPEMLTVLECQEYAPDSVMWNLPQLFRMKKEIDPLRLAEAVDRVLRSHPVYSTVIEYDAYSVPMQKYAPELFEGIPIIRIREEEFESLKSSLIRPFYPSDGFFYRCAIYQTEENCYLFFDHYHLISDGSSLRLLFRQISRCYRDEAYAPPKDYYYYMIREEEKKRLQGEAEELEQYYRDFHHRFFVRHNTQINVRYDFQTSGASKSKKYLARIEAQKADILSRAGVLSENVFFLAACLLAIASYNRSDSVFLQWVTNGRDTKEKNQMAGMLFRSVPLAATLDPNQTLREFYDELLAQVRYTTTHTISRFASSLGAEYDESLFFLFQKDIFKEADFDLAEQMLPLQAEDKYAESTIEMMVFDEAADGYLVSIEYDTGKYSPDSIETFFACFNSAAAALAQIDAPEKIRLSDILDDGK